MVLGESADDRLGQEDMGRSLCLIHELQAPEQMLMASADKEATLSA